MDTIYALSSGSGRAAVAVIRVSGTDTAAVLQALCGPLPPPRSAALRTLIRPSDGEVLDRGLVLWFPAPRSFTGEDLCEFHLHGSRAVVQAAFEVLASLGVRIALAGEFSRRAFGNGKLDLTELEGLADLMAAETEYQRRQAVLQAGGGLRIKCESWRETLLDLRAAVEARIDFSDEGDVTPAVPATAWSRLARLREEIAAALNSASSGERLRDGFSVAILGPPNVGKSSLLNALAGRDIAIVTAEAGTTRDIMEVSLDIAGHPVRLFDTAGIRESDSEAERIGVQRAESLGRAVDLVLWLFDGSVDAVEPPKGACDIWRIRSKADLHSGSTGSSFSISVVSGEGIDALVKRLGQAAASAQGNGSALVSRERQRVALRAALEALAGVDGQDDEVAAELLRQACDSMGRVTTSVGVEDVLDRLFAEFCIGK